MPPEFIYKAKTPDSKFVKGTMQAESRLDVADYIHKQNYYVVSIEEKKDIDLKKILKFFNRIKLKELAVLSRQFAVLFNAGVPIVQCLDILIDQIENKHLKREMAEIYQDVEVGMSFSEALERREATFPILYSRMINAGETGGILDVVMNRLADYYERESELMSRVQSAMIYPIVLLFIAVIVIIFLMTTVVPVFAELFSSMGGTLPLPTRIVIGASNILSEYWYLILIFGFIFIVSLISYLRSPKGKYKFHNLQLKLPIFGKLIIKIEVARFTRTLGSLLKSGVPIMEALRVVEKIISNQIIANRLTDARLRVREGIRLSEPLRESGVFPRMMVQMLAVGEETGTMDEMFEKIAQFYDKEAENSIKATMSLIEPLLIILMAVFVGFIVIAIVMPMFGMMDLI